MACLDVVNSNVVQGNDWFLDITVTEDGVINADTGNPENPKDLTGASVSLSLKETKQGAQVIAPTITITDATSGRISMSLTAAQTETLVSSGAGSRILYGAPKVVYSDSTVDDLFQLQLTICESWN